jgi:hypothetical protein
MIIVMGIYISYVTTNKISIYNYESKKSIAFSEMKTDIENYINLCIKNSAKDAILDTGIREETLGTYKSLVNSKIKGCVSPFFNQLREENYKITEGELNVYAEINPETLAVSISYPITIEYEGQKIELKEFNYVFDRSSSVKIPGGVTDREVRIISPNEKAQIIIPPGVKITDKNGNPVENIGIKIEDLHFDGLQNKYVVGQLVYDNLPDGLTFSQPVEFSIEFREKDIPQGYTKENIMISYWDNNTRIWYALDTEIRENKAITNITHFSEYTCNVLSYWIIKDKLFQQRFSPYAAGINGNGVWLIGGKNENEGTATIQKTYYTSSYTDLSLTQAENVRRFANGDGILAVKTDYGNEYEDFREILITNTEKFIFFPKVEFGYYPDSDPSKEDSFINCETQDETIENMLVSLGDEPYPYPYFQVCNLGCRSNLKCECNPEKDCSNSCDINNIRTCFGNSAGNLCIPIPNSEETVASLTYPYAKQIIHCSEISSGQSCIPNSEKIFGWHNYQCAGGRVRPAEGTTASDFIVFQDWGNAVLYAGSLNAIVKPSSAYSNSRTFEVGIDSNGNQITGQTLPYYCRLTPYPDSFGLTQLPISIPELGSGSGYGIYGIDIIKKTTDVNAKIDLHADCSVYWMFLGEGVIRSNVPQEFFEATQIVSNEGLVAFEEAFGQELPPFMVNWIRN